MIITEKTRNKLHAKMGINESLYIVMNNGTYSKQHEMRVSSVIKTAPVFKTAGFDGQSLVVSLPTYMRLCGDGVEGFSDIPMKRLLIKTKN